MESWNQFLFGENLWEWKWKLKTKKYKNLLNK